MIPNLDVILNLREQINERPDDYPLRLVYADALEEYDQDWSRIEAKAIRSKVWQRSAFYDMKLSAREGCFAISGRSSFTLWTGDRKNWIIEIVRCSMQGWIKHGKELIKHHPIRRVRITDRNPVDDHVHLPRNLPWAVSEPDRDNITNIHNFEMVPMWIWYESQIPQEIFRVLLAQEQYFDHVWVDDLNQETRFDRQIRYFSSRIARLALSDACIQWAKSINKSTVQITS